MRPVEKGEAPRIYTDYGQARHDLADIIGYYCSYCEMRVFNSIEVEHILPQNQGGAPLDWSNFLLSCKYCNTIKSDHNDNLENFLWPDIDNTDLAFHYSEGFVIQPISSISPENIQLSQNAIDLMGLDRIPGSINEPTKADTRWRAREAAWSSAKISYHNWSILPIKEMAQQIAITALLAGNYSIWMEIFKDIDEVLIEIDNLYRTKGLYKEFDNTNERLIREGGRL